LASKKISHDKKALENLVNIYNMGIKEKKKDADTKNKEK